ncbi:energy coupling factor transporter S component ThiW [uncultured Chloroflexus sp.]|uniref:energy coupling factor transporter S component ThiW n=1 Tax=uncultured Chloroflexus sp. TaxID=214040 RepID=UPI002626D926|nr:energy coupling factor transporter S component ThiW [uncultured Chloroflexus sp.]
MPVHSRLIARAIVLIAIGVALAPFTSFPIGIARVNPTQHFINVVAAVTLGPWWAVIIAAIIAIIRNAMGVGTVLAFPGGMIGALLAGLVYRYTRNVYLSALGEIVGTGIIAAVVSALIVAPIFMGKTMAVGVMVASFLGSTVIGSMIGVLALKLLARTGLVEPAADIQAQQQ